MRLTYGTEATINEYLIQGTILRYDKDAALGNTLTKIRDNGWKSLGDISVFERGLKNYFVSMGYLTSDLRITPLGEEVAKTKMAWKGMSGRFILKIIRYDDSMRIIDCKACGVDPNNNYEQVEDALDLTDIYDCSNEKIIVENIDPIKLKYPSSKVEVAVSFDYSTGEEEYHAKGITFKNTENFSIVNSDVAQDILEKVMSNHRNISTFKDEIIYNKNDGDPLTDKLIEEILSSDGSFEKHKDLIEEYLAKGVTITDARLKVSNTILAEELFHKFIIKKSVSNYYRKEEIGEEISQFYRLFNGCPQIKSSPKKIRDDIIDQLQSNEIPRLRLQACIDLDSSITIKPSPKNIDLSSKRISMNEFVKMAFGGSMISLTMFSKYPSNNPDLSKKILLLSESVHDIFDIKMKLITTELSTKRSELKQAFELIKNCPNIELKIIDEAEARKIHDRYYLIVNEDKSKLWMKTSGELDDINYDDDEPNTETIGTVSEMSISYHNCDTIPPIVRKMMEGGQ